MSEQGRQNEDSRIHLVPVNSAKVLDEPSGYTAGDRVRVFGDDGPLGTVVSGDVVEDSKGYRVLNVAFDDEDTPGGRWPLLMLVTEAL